MLIRPSFTLGGSGGGMAYNADELRDVADHGLRASPVGQVLIEQSVLGWKEYELEVMRDRADNFVVVCSIENLDPMGVHTGDSITVAPAQTLTDHEFQRLRDMARTVIQRVGVETGGSNVQFAVNPRDGAVVVIEMNPRVSRSSALASKATGFPIAKIAALLAVGYTLDEIPNDITRVTPASFEPSLDYVVVKIPRWDFEKFPGADPTLGPQMKSGGRGDGDRPHLPRGAAKGGARAGDRRVGLWLADSDQARPSAGDGSALELPTAPQLRLICAWPRRCAAGRPSTDVAAATGFDPWFVDQMAGMLDDRSAHCAAHAGEPAARAAARGQAPRASRDAQIARLLGCDRDCDAVTALAQLAASTDAR